MDPGWQCGSRCCSRGRCITTGSVRVRVVGRWKDGLTDGGARQKNQIVHEAKSPDLGTASFPGPGDSGVRQEDRGRTEG